MALQCDKGPQCSQTSENCIMLYYICQYYFLSVQHVKKEHSRWDGGSYFQFAFHKQELQLELKEENFHQGWRIMPADYPCMVQPIMGSILVASVSSKVTFADLFTTIYNCNAHVIVRSPKEGSN